MYIMSINIINNVLDNLEDMSYGVSLPIVKINNRDYAVGLQYENNEINYRNLYIKEKKQFIKKGVIKYLTPKLLNDTKEYEIFIEN